MFIDIIPIVTGFCLGWEVGTTGSLLEAGQFGTAFDKADPLLTGVFISSFNLGSVIGCLCLTRLKKFPLNLVVSSWVYILGTVTQMCCIQWPFINNFWLLMAARTLCGVGCGALGVLGPVYIGQLVEDIKQREYILSKIQWVVCGTILAGTCLLHFYPNALVTLSISLVAMVILQAFLVPGSLIKPKMEEKDSPNPPVDWKSVVKCCCVMSFQQLSGINYFFYFGASLFPPSTVILMSSVNLVGSIISKFFIGTFGSVRLLKFGGMILSLILLSYAIFGMTLVTKIPLIILTCFFIFTFAITWGPCAGILNSSISGNNKTVMGIATSANWLVNMIIVLITPICISKLGFACGIFFAVNMAVLAIYIDLI